MALTTKQRKFAEVFDGNGAAACRAAGYKGTVQALSTQAKRLLNNAEVKKALAAREAKETGPLIADREARQAFWTKVMNGMAPVKLPDGSVEEMPVEMKDRLKASELLGKSQADFTEKVEHSGTVKIAVVDPYAVKPEGSNG